MIRLEAHQLEHLGRPGLDGRLVAPPVNLQRLGDGLADGDARVERGERILEDDLEIPADLAHVSCAELGELNPFERDRARGRTRQLQDRASRRRLAATRLAHQAQGLAGSDGEGDAGDRVDLPDTVPDERATAHGEVFDEVGDFEQWCGRRCGVGCVLGHAHAITLSTTPSEKI